jgi:hypothetical protein
MPVLENRENRGRCPILDEKWGNVPGSLPYNEVVHLESLRQKRPGWLASLPDSEFLNIED